MIHWNNFHKLANSQTKEVLWRKLEHQVKSIGFIGLLIEEWPNEISERTTFKTKHSTLKDMLGTKYYKFDKARKSLLREANSRSSTRELFSIISKSNIPVIYSELSRKYWVNIATVKIFAEYGITVNDSIICSLQYGETGDVEHILFLSKEIISAESARKAIALCGAYALVAERLRTVEGGKTSVMSTDLNEHKVKRSSSKCLSVRQIEVLRLAGGGENFENIAENLSISVPTVRHHIENAREKYGFSTNTQTIVQAALDYGLSHSNY